MAFAWLDETTIVLRENIRAKAERLVKGTRRLIEPRAGRNPHDCAQNEARYSKRRAAIEGVVKPSPTLCMTGRIGSKRLDEHIDVGEIQFSERLYCDLRRSWRSMSSCSSTSRNLGKSTPLAGPPVARLIRA
jgi:hypothetical protein